MILRPPSSVVDLVQRIAQGHLDNQAVTVSNDESGSLLQALTTMDGQLAGIVRGIKASHLRRTEDRLDVPLIVISYRIELRQSASEQEFRDACFMRGVDLHIGNRRWP